jgi:hypothetical protein
MKSVSRPVNFHAAHVQLNRNIHAAARSVALWKALQRRAAKVKPLNRETCFLDAAMLAAWTSAIVRCYALVDSHKSSLSLKRLLQLSAENDPRTAKPFISEAERDRIEEEVNVAKRLSKYIEVLRHNEEAHISSFVTIPEIRRTTPRARDEIVRFLEQCVKAFEDISLAAYGEKLPIPAYEKEIDDDLDILLTVYPQLRGFAEATLTNVEAAELP